MTWTAQAQTPVNILAYRVDDNRVQLSIGVGHVTLNPEQRRGLAEYLVKDLPAPE